MLLIFLLHESADFSFDFSVCECLGSIVPLLADGVAEEEPEREYSHGVATYLLFVARDMTERSNPVMAEISLIIIGFSRYTS